MLEPTEALSPSKISTSKKFRQSPQSSSVVTQTTALESSSGEPAAPSPTGGALFERMASALKIDVDGLKQELGDDKEPVGPGNDVASTAKEATKEGEKEGVAPVVKEAVKEGKKDPDADLDLSSVLLVEKPKKGSLLERMAPESRSKESTEPPAASQAASSAGKTPQPTENTPQPPEDPPAPPEESSPEEARAKTPADKTPVAPPAEPTVDHVLQMPYDVPEDLPVTIEVEPEKSPSEKEGNAKAADFAADDVSSIGSSHYSDLNEQQLMVKRQALQLQQLHEQELAQQRRRHQQRQRASAMFSGFFGAKKSRVPQSAAPTAAAPPSHIPSHVDASLREPQPRSYEEKEDVNQQSATTTTLMAGFFDKKSHGDGSSRKNHEPATPESKAAMDGTPVEEDEKDVDEFEKLQQLPVDPHKFHPKLYVSPSKALKNLFTKIRDVNSNAATFIFYSKRAMRIVAEDTIAELPAKEVTVTTPTGTWQGVEPVATERLCAVSIIRAGDALLECLRECLPNIPVGKILIQRDESSPDKTPKMYYGKLPPDIVDKDAVILCDPMLATGGSAKMAIGTLVGVGVPPEKIIFANVICCPEGLRAMAEAYPQVKIVTGMVDERLDEKKYIVPGLGDYGDRFFNTVAED